MAKSLLLPTETFSKEIIVLKFPIKKQFMQNGSTTSILQHPVESIYISETEEESSANDRPTDSLEFISKQKEGRLSVAQKSFSAWTEKLFLRSMSKKVFLFI